MTLRQESAASTGTSEAWRGHLMPSMGSTHWWVAPTVPIASRRFAGTAIVLMVVLLTACGTDSTSQDPAADNTTTTSAPITTSTSVQDEGTATTVGASGPLDGAEMDFGVLGPVQVGMSLDEVEEAGGLSVREDAPGDPSCAYWFPVEQPNVDMIALDGKLAEITVAEPFVTVQGLGVGSTRSEVIAAFGSNDVEERTNRFQIEELLVLAKDPAGSNLGLVFVLVAGGDTVEFVKTGTLEALRLDEGCV